MQRVARSTAWPSPAGSSPGAASLTAFAATLGPSRADAALKGPGIGLVLPIPTTLNIFGQEFHVQAPPFTGADSDPSSVYNFELGGRPCVHQWFGSTDQPQDW